VELFGILYRTVRDRGVVSGYQLSSAFLGELELPLSSDFFPSAYDAAYFGLCQVQTMASLREQSYVDFATNVDGTNPRCCDYVRRHCPATEPSRRHETQQPESGHHSIVFRGLCDSSGHVSFFRLLLLSYEASYPDEE